MKVLLIQCPCSYGAEMPPLGLAYLASFLKKNNYDVSILDLSILLYEQVDEENKKYWDSNNGYCWYLTDIFRDMPFLSGKIYNKFINKILSTGGDVLGFSVQNTSAIFTLEIIKRIKTKSPSKKIILGGPNCYNITGVDSDFKLQNDLQKFSDFIVVGEGEETSLNLLRCIEDNKPLDECKGIAIPRDGKWHFTGFAKPIMNLDNLPFPAFDIYNLESYTNKKGLPILTSRGCINRCVFCTDSNFWLPYRHRSTENITAEIMRIHQKYKNNFLSFNDSLINGNFRNLWGICDFLIEKKLKISWGGNCRVNKRLDLELLKRMKKAGCQYLNVGIESGSNRILALMRKGFTIEEAASFIYNCSKAGINVVVNWIVGFPGETKEDFTKTVDFIVRHKGLIKRNTFSTLTVNQFSYLARYKKEFGIILDSPHLGLWHSTDGRNTIEFRNSRLQYLEDIERQRNRDYNIVRQKDIQK
jgi:radical SAM superfamily enzyme YgiQ (UPF0313 family)